MRYINCMSELIDPEKLIGLTDAAREFGYNAEHLRQLVVQGKIKAWRVAGAWITTRENVLEYMRSRKSEGWPPRATPKHLRSTKNSHS